MRYALLAIILILLPFIMSKECKSRDIKTKDNAAINTKGVDMEKYSDKRDKDFLTNNGIDKLEIASDNQWVVADWSDPYRWPTFKGSRWEIDNTHTKYKSDQGVLREWIIRKGKEMLSIEILISSRGNKAALERLVSLAVNTTSMEVPFKKAEGLGDFYLVSINPRSKNRLWIYRNICVDMRYYAEDDSETSFDTFALAQDIQKYAEKHLKKNIHYYYPEIASVEITPKIVHVGDIVNVSLTIAGNKDMDNYVMESELSKNLDSMRNDVLTVRAKALEPGTGEVKVTVFDKKTLLSVQKTVKIEMLEKESK